MFDAGAIEARLVVNLDQFDKGLDRAEARVRRLTDKVYRVRVAAVFDESSLGRARSMFAQLDNALSKDAMSRLRSSPQGSVLGTLNALFSPHPVTGAPSAQQAAQQGLLGKMISGSGGGVGQTVQRNIIRDVIGVNDAQVKAEGARAGREAADAAAKAATAESKRKGGLVTNLIEKTTTEQTRTVTTKSVVRDVLGVDETKARNEGAKAGKEAADAAASEAVKEGGKRQGLLGGLFAGVAAGIGSRLGGLFGGGGGKGGSGGGGIGGAGAGLLNGIGPGVPGVGAKLATLLGLGGAGLGALPALLGIAGGGLFLGLGALIDKIGIKQLIGSKNTSANPNAQGPLYQQAQQLKSALGNIMQNAAAGLQAPLVAAFKVLPGLVNSLAGPLRQLFAGAGTLIGPAVTGLGNLARQVLPLLGQGLKAVAPLLTPLLGGLTKLLTGLLPGIITVIKAAMPAFNALSAGLGTIGKGLGSLFADAAPVIRASSTIFKALLDVVAALFPIIGKLAQIFAAGLAPVFVAFTSIVQSLLPFLVIVGKVLASLAGAVLTDLVAAFSALAQLLKAVAPSFTVLAGALSSVFQVLENTGVFAVFGNALESIVPLLAKLINTLIMGLAPAFPVIITAVAQLATLLANLLAAGLNTLLEALIPIIGWLAKLTVSVINWLSANKLLMPVLLAVAAVLAGPVVTAVVALIAVIGLAATHWKQIWGDIRNWTNDFIKFLVRLFNSLPAPVKAVLTAIWDSWKAAWDVISAYAKIVWAVLKAEFTIVFDALAAIFKIILAVMTGNWTAAWNAIKAFGVQVWNALRDAAGAIWNAMKAGLGAALGAMKAEWLAVWSAISSAATGLWNGIKAALSFLMGSMSTIWSSGWGQIVAFAKGIPGKILGVLNVLTTDLDNLGQSIMTGFWTGVKKIWTTVEGWFGGLPAAILHALGIHSPPAWAIDAGSHIMGGLLKGIAHGASDVRGFFRRIALDVTGPFKGIWSSLASAGKDIWHFLFGGGGAPSTSGNVVSWLKQAMAATMAPASWLPALEQIVARESGGNPFAVNPIPVMGEHASGLMQTLPSTYAQFATVPGGVFNPVSDAVAAIRYIMATWGSPYNIPYLFSGPYKGYAYGTMSAAPGWAWVGEHGPELMRFRGGEQVVPAGGGGSGGAGLVIPGVGHLGEGPAPGGGGGGGSGGIVNQTVRAHLHRLHMLHLAHLHHLHELHLKHLAHLAHLAAEGGGHGTGAGTHRHGRRTVIGPRGLHGGGSGGGSPGGLHGGGSGGGGLVIPGVGHLGEGTAPGGGTPGWAQQLLDKLDTLTSVTAQVPAAVGDYVGGAIGGAAYSASFRARYPLGGA